MTLIGMPLPANMVVADALSPIAPPEPNNNGCCQSKYLRDTSTETFLQNIKDSKYWKDCKDDPMFDPLSEPGNIVSFEEVYSNIKSRQLRGEGNDELVRDSRSQTRSVSVRQDAADMKSSLESLERALAEAKEKQAELMRNRELRRGSRLRSVKVEDRSPTDVKLLSEKGSPPQSATSDKEAKSVQNTEDVLAALGVTGTPKPVTPIQDSPGGLSMLHGRSPSKENAYVASLRIVPRLRLTLIIF